MEKEQKQCTLFEMKEWWEDEWQDMPEYNQFRIKPIRTIKINFRSKDDIEAFEKLINQKISASYNNYWYPKINIRTRSDKKYIDEP